MSKRLISIEDSALITSGVSVSEHVRKAPLWVNSSNVEFNDGKVRKQKGWAAPITEPAASQIRGMNQVVKAGVQTLYWGDLTALHKWNSATVTTEGTGYTLLENATVNSPAGMWSLEPWGTFMTACNGTTDDGLLVDKQDGNGFVAMGGTPPTQAEILIKKGIQLVALNTNLGGTFIQWCDDDDIDDWAGGNAGSLNIRDLDSEIKGAARLGDKIAVYAENTLALLSYPLAGFIFGAKVVLEGIGLVGKHAVVTRGKKNYGMSNSGLWITDGTSFQYIDAPKVQTWIQDNVNWAQKSKINAVLLEHKKCIEWAVPTGAATEPNRIIAFNFETNSFAFRDYGRTIQMPAGVFADPYAGTAGGEVFQHNTTVNANGAAITAFIQSKPFVSRNEDGDIVDTQVDYVRLLLDEYTDVDGSILAYIGTQADLDEAIVWTALEAAAGKDGKKNFVGAAIDNSAYISFKLESTGVNDTWALSGVEVYGETAGEME